MTPEQYDEFLDDLRVLRRALDLPDGALAMSPREAFLECTQMVEARHLAARIDERERVVSWLLRIDRPRLAARIENGEHTGGIR